MISHFNFFQFCFSVCFGFFSGIAINFLRIRIPEAIIYNDKILLAELLGKKVKNNIRKFKFFDRFWHKSTSLYMGFLFALIAILFFLYFHFSTKTLILFVLLSALVLLALIDFFNGYLPDVITMPLMWLGLFIQLSPSLRTVGLESSVIGIFTGYLSLLLINLIYFLFKKRSGVGYGDIKLMAMLGAWYGPYPLPSILFLASILGLIWHLKDLDFSKIKSSSSFPFGPYIVFVSVFYLITMK